MFGDILHYIAKTERSLRDRLIHNKYLRTSYPDEIKKVKNTAIRNRCFIVGNGPSLKKDDLAKLADEDCFACNRIYGLYENIDWRPKYYCSQDYKLLAQITGDLSYAIDNCSFAFFPWNHRKLFSSVVDHKKVFLFFRPYVSVYSKDGKYHDGLIPFSDDISNGIYDGLSVTYAMIQIAVYMGYTEIYLLGIDHNYPMKNGKVDVTLSYAEGIKPIDMSNQYPPELTLCEVAYKEARKYCEAHGIRIMNATRGGKLEVFDRIDLDDLLEGR